RQGSCPHAAQSLGRALAPTPRSASAGLLPQRRAEPRQGSCPNAAQSLGRALAPTPRRASAGTD
ncbi:MAG: hypothetical protein RBU30_18375, partial [Polyangia bacterium]|nr:hypothetical protein [Polyangia bacterium]